MNRNLAAIIAVMLTGCLLIFYQLGTEIQSGQQENRERQAGEGMQEAKTGLVQFISQRTENVSGQFRAKLASSGNEGNKSNTNSIAPSAEEGAAQGKGIGTGNRQGEGDRQAPNDNQQGSGRPGHNQQFDRANAGAGGKPFGGMQPGGGPGNNGEGRQGLGRGPGGRPEDNQTVSTLSSDQLYLIGGSLLVLLASSVLLLRKKTKYSI